MSRISQGCFGLIVLGTATFSACGHKSPTEPTPDPCTYTLSASSLTFGAAGGSNSVTVTAASHCTWTATSDRGWMSITTGATGTGGGTVGVTVAPNSAIDARTGTLTIAGQAVAATQEGLGACTLDISPDRVTFTQDSGTGTFSVIAPGHCEWSATSNAAWLAVSSGGQGTGNGTVSYSVERNREVTARSGGIAVGQRVFMVTQSGDLGLCEYSVTPLEFNPCMPSFNLSATITTRDECTWTAAPDASWITMTGGQSGAGSGTISFTGSENWDAPRQSVVMVRWPTPSAGQNLRVSQAGCHYAVSSAAINLPASGGTGRFDVYQVSDPISCGGATQSACRWTAQVDVPWITITTTMPQAGDNPVSFTVAQNDSTLSRGGTITVRDQLVRVTQSGR